MRIENIRDDNGKFYSKRALFDYLKNNKQTEYEDFKLHLLIWCKNCVQEKYEQTYTNLQQYISEFLSLFNCTICKSSDFIYSKSDDHLSISSTKVNNISSEDITIDIQTIHSIKGRTVTGVLYLDTFNGLNCSKAPSKYESGKLSKYFLGDFISNNKNEESYIIQAAKMIYVGFSRPTHLLCYAVQKDNYENYLSTINHDEWNVMEI